MALRAQKQSLYNVEWQVLRVSLLGGWTHLDGTKRNIDKLIDYLSKDAMSVAERKTRLWRVLNCLNAVRMGNSGQQRANEKHDVYVAMYRDKVSKEYKMLGDDIEFVVDSEEKVRADWALVDAKTQKAVRDNLAKRRKLHADSVYRDELSWFLSLIGG